MGKAWTTAEDGLFAVETNEAIAAKTGRSLASVKMRRGRIGATSRRGWTPADVKALKGKGTDAAIAKATGRSVAAIRRKRSAIRRGTSSAGDLAKRLGDEVRRRRGERSIENVRGDVPAMTWLGVETGAGDVRLSTLVAIAGRLGLAAGRLLDVATRSAG